MSVLFWKYFTLPAFHTFAWDYAVATQYDLTNDNNVSIQDSSTKDVGSMMLGRSDATAELVRVH